MRDNSGHSSNQNNHETNESPMFQAWNRFIDQLSHQKCHKFPHEAIATFLNPSPHSTVLATLKDLVQLLPHVLNKYTCDYEKFEQIVILLHLIICKKGCSSKAVLTTAANVLQNLLKYRIILVCSSRSGKSKINSVYEFMISWLDELVPKILQHDHHLLISILKNINNKSDKSEVDRLLLLFELLLIKKISNNLSQQSSPDFFNFLSQICSTKKLNLIREATANHGEDLVIEVQDFVFLREDQQKWQFSDLILSQNQASHELILRKTPHKGPMESWVRESYQKKPQPVDVSFSKISSMRTMELYRYLCLLQIFGGSPFIEVLDDYMDNQQFLDLFGKFLMGTELCDTKYRYGNESFKELLDSISKKMFMFSSAEKKALAYQIQQQYQPLFFS